MSENIVGDEGLIMKLKYREIKRRRCKEIDRWKIKDPYGDGTIFTAEGEKFVTNWNESVLFCHAFSPRSEVSNEHYAVFLFIKNKEYNFVRYDLISYADEKRGSTSVRYEDFVILEEEFIEKSNEKKELLELLKCLISKYELEFCVLEEIRAMEHQFKFYYKGVEI